MVKISHIEMDCHYLVLFKFTCVLYQLIHQAFPITKINQIPEDILHEMENNTMRFHQCAISLCLE